MLQFILAHIEHGNAKINADRIHFVVCMYVCMYCICALHVARVLCPTFNAMENCVGKRIKLEIIVLCHYDFFSENNI